MDITWSGRLAGAGASVHEIAAIQASYDDAALTVQQALDELIAGVDNVTIAAMLAAWRIGPGPFAEGFYGAGLPFGTRAALLTGDVADDTYAISAGTGVRLAAAGAAGLTAEIARAEAAESANAGAVSAEAARAAAAETLLVPFSRFPPGAAFYDVIGNSIPGGGGVTNGAWNGYVDKLMFLLGSPRRKRDLSIGGAVACFPSAQNQTGDGGWGHVLGQLSPVPPAISAGGPFLPQADIADCHITLNDLAILGVANPTPMQEAVRTILARLVAAAISQANDSTLSYTGTWAGPTVTAGQCSPAGLKSTSTLNDSLSIAFPQISQDAGNRYIDFTAIVHPADDYTLGVTIDGASQPDVRLQGSVVCSPAGYSGAGAQANACTRRYLVDGHVTHTMVLTLKTQTVGGSTFFFDSATIEADPADGPVAVVPNAHRCTSYALWGVSWPNGAGMSDAHVLTWNGFLQSVAAEFPHALYVDIDSALNKDTGFFLPSATNDGAHPNPAGHGVIAKTIFDMLLSAGKMLSRQFSRVSPAMGQLWLPVGAAINSYPAFQNSWVNLGGAFGTVGYRKDVLGNVHIRGWVKSGSSGGAVIFTLPAGFRPEIDTYRTTFASGTVMSVKIAAATGNVNMNANGATGASSLEGITFPAAQ